MTALANTHLGHGVRFNYPAGWLVTEEQSGDDVSLTAADEGAALWSITILPGRPDPKQVLQQALKAFEEEYADVDVVELPSELAGLPALGIDIDFECLELPVVASLRAFRTRDNTFLVLCQCSGDELGELEPVFEAMNGSLKCVE